MSLDLIQKRLATYPYKTGLEEEQALREISQEVILMALSRQDFFTVAEFHGGTALRIFYGLPRFSEDLDFALLKPDPTFSLSPYLKNISEELHAFGYEFEVVDRSTATSSVKKAFLKDDSIGKMLVLKRSDSRKKLVIKIEVDANPPLGAQTEIKYLDFPAPFEVRAKNLPSSFAGKLHALLCREYVKGRDWYDFIWYVSRQTFINFVLLENALKQMGPWKNKPIKVDIQWIIDALREKIKKIDWAAATSDVMPFIKAHEQPSLKIWGTDFFLAETDKLASYLNKKETKK